MANIITISYFEKEIFIPQLSQATVIENVENYIKTYEPEYLKNVLGYSLAKAFIDALAGNSPAQKWLDLRDGKEFTDPNNENTIKWMGFRDTTNYQSPIAYYVYYQYRKYNTTITAPTGEIVASNENSNVISPARKMSFAWNKMVVWNYLLWQFLWVNKTSYDLEESDFGNFHYNGYTQYYLLNADFINQANTINDFDL